MQQYRYWLFAAYSDIRGVVFNTNGNLSNFKTGNSLVGYRIEYLDGNKKNGNYKIITSSNKAEAINVMLNKLLIKV